MSTSTTTAEEMRRTMARMEESMKSISSTLSQVGRSYAQAAEAMAATLRAHVGPPAPGDRAYARRAHRAAMRSLRNQPPAPIHPDSPGRGLATWSRKRRPHGRPR